MKLTHWTDKKFEIKLINGKGEFRELRGIPSFKPTGFWLSVNNSWENWIKDNWDSWTEGKVCLNVELDTDINLFIIETKLQFMMEFRKLTGIIYKELDILERISLYNFHKRLKEKYDGIWLKSEPFYRHRMDFDFMYFYTWDCESICIFNKEKIKFNKLKGGND